MNQISLSLAPARVKIYYSIMTSTIKQLCRHLYFMTAAEVDQDQGLLTLVKAVGTRLLNTVIGIFYDEQEKVDEGTDFLVEKLLQNNSVVCSYLPGPTLQELQEIKTTRGFTLKDGLRRGIREKDKLGILAGDEESYVLFQNVFDPLVKAIHGSSPVRLQSSSLDPEALGEIAFDRNCVLSCRIRVLRSLKGFPFSWFCSRDERVSVENLITALLEKLQGQGEYIPLGQIQEQNLNHILQSHRLFLKQRSLSSNQAWKEGRGIWHDRQNRLLLLINEDEHVKIICQQFGCDLFLAYKKVRELLLELESLLKRNGYEFMRSDHYGYLSSRPQELGAPLRVSVNVHLPLTAKDPRLAFILKCLDLQQRKPGIHFPEVETSRVRIFEVSNSKRIGMSEVKRIQQVVTGVNRLIEMEELLEKSRHMDLFISKIMKNAHDMK